MTSVTVGQLTQTRAQCLGICQRCDPAVPLEGPLWLVLCAALSEYLLDYVEEFTLEVVDGVHEHLAHRNASRGRTRHAGHSEHWASCSKAENIKFI